MEQAREVKLQIFKSSQGDITFIRLAGTIDESFDGSALGKGLKGKLVISLAEVRRITSFGIRQWMDFVTKASETCSVVYFIECSPRIFDQFNMVTNFGGRGAVVSFYAPYRCDHCGSESLQLVQVDRDHEMLRELRLDPVPCPKDGQEAVFDDEPESYLSYIATQPPFELDPQIAAFLAGRTQYAVLDGMRKTRIEKKVRDRYTFISIGGDIGADFPVRKIAEGLEGDVVFDLAGVGRIGEDGVRQWRALLQAIAPSTERILVLGYPAVALEQMSRNEDLAEKGQVLSLYLPYSCKTCQITSQLEVDVAKHYEVLRFATPPEMGCPDCRAPATPVASEAMLSGLTELPQPAGDLPTAKLIEWARAPAEPLPVAPARTAAAAGPTVIAPGRGWHLLVAFSLLAVIGAGVAVYLAVRQDVPVDNFAKQATLLEASHPHPPAWKDQALTIQGDQVLVGGSSGYVEDKEDGFRVAKAAALDELSNQVATSIRDPSWIEHVGSQFLAFRTRALGELEKALVSGEDEAIRRARARVEERRERVAQALSQGAAGIFRPEQGEFYWEKLRGGQVVRYRVWALLRLSKDQLRKLAEHYSTREEALSAFAVSYFPGMSWRYDLTHGAVIVSQKPDSPLRYIGAVAGDIVASAQDRTIRDARGFRRVLTEEHAELERNGGTMIVRIQRGDAPVIEHRLAVAKKKVKEQPVGAGTKRPRPAPDGKRPVPANIWDDDIFQ